MNYIVGIDLGTMNDFTAVSVIRKHRAGTGVFDVVDVPISNGEAFEKRVERTETEYHLVHLERYLGDPYTKIVESIEKIAERPELRGSKTIVDCTGVGRPVVDQMIEKGLKNVVPVTITGGDSVTEARVNGRREYRVPKRDLVGVTQVLLENRRFKILSSLPLRDELVREMQNFRVKLNAETGHASYEHWRSQDHDDLVLAVALSLWYGERKKRTLSAW